MRLFLAAVFATSIVALPAGLRAQDSNAQTKQSNQAGTPATAENFDTAKNYIERARKLGFPAAGATAPYVLHGEFTTRDSKGAVATGTYTDTWLSDTQWRREAVLDDSHYVRTRNGKKYSLSMDGPEAGILQLVLTVFEPLPAPDPFKESDWTVTRDTIDGVSLIRIAKEVVPPATRGRQASSGDAPPKRYAIYWFDGAGDLVSSSINGLEIRRTDISDLNGLKVAHKMEVLLGGKPGLEASVTGMEPAGQVDPKIFSIKDKDWIHIGAVEAR